MNAVFKFVLFCCFVLSFFDAVCLAQDNVEVVKYEVLNYPPTAAAIGISGIVNVQATIDRDGNASDTIVSSGHPLLRRICENNVKLWKFNSSGDEKRTFSAICSFILVDMAKTDYKVISKTEHEFINPNQIIIKATLVDEPRDCCSRPTSVWQKISSPFRHVGLFVKKVFS